MLIKENAIRKEIQKNGQRTATFYFFKCKNCNQLKSNTLTQEETLKIITYLKTLREGKAWD